MLQNQRGYLHWRIYNESKKQVLCYTVMVQTQTYVQKFLRRMYEEEWLAQDADTWNEYKRNQHIFAQFKNHYINNTHGNY